METQVLQRVKKDCVKFISLQFTDLLGLIKEVIIPSERLDEALINGVWFDGSSIEGFARIQESDLYLKLDPTTYSVVPWSSENDKTARLICDIYSPDEEPFEGDPRLILKRVMDETSDLGYQFNIGPEPEFYIFKNNSSLERSLLDTGSYFDLTSHEGYRLIKEIVMALRNFDINVETSHHEVGQGQYEVDFRYGPALQIADKLVTLKYTVKKIAQIYDLHATFMPKPIMNAAGSGMHVHQSLLDLKKKKNAFYDANDKYKLSRIAYNFIAGQIRHIKSLCAILCPTVNSYKRLVAGFEAPTYITWASMNRSALIRVPKWFKQKPESSRIELRCPDPTCNPYLAFAVMLKAGLEGIKEDLIPPEPVEENIYKFDNSILEKKNIDLLPTSLWEAMNEAKNDGLIKEVLGEHLYEKYIDIKSKEWNEFKMQVTSWETNKYLDIY